MKLEQAIGSSKDILDDNCRNRVKPSLLRDVKTEALLVFARTALERFFTRLDQMPSIKESMSEDYKIYIYDSLLKLRDSLQVSVVNADYLINLMSLSQKYPQLHSLVRFEEPLIQYYDVMADKVATHYKTQELRIPEFLVICVLSHWVLEEEKSTALYPFLNDYDYTLLIEKFELHREALYLDDVDMIEDVHKVSLQIVERLKKTKYKMKKSQSTTKKKRK